MYLNLDVFCLLCTIIEGEVEGRRGRGRRPRRTFVEQRKRLVSSRTKKLNSWRKIEKNGRGFTDKSTALKCYDHDDVFKEIRHSWNRLKQAINKDYSSSYLSRFIAVLISLIRDRSEWSINRLRWSVYGATQHNGIPVTELSRRI